jgi:uncharacterized integral membrane protein (TIGR00698 family)
MSEKQALLKTEDWIAVWLGFLIIVLITVGVRPQMPTFKWSTTGEFKAAVTKSVPSIEKLITSAQEKGEADLLTAATVLKGVMESQDRKAIGNAAKTLGEVASQTQDVNLKKKGGEISKKLAGEAGSLLSKIFSGKNILQSIFVGIAYLILASIGIALIGGRVGAFITGFPIVYVLAWLAQFIAGNATVTYWGLEYVIWALLIGLFISNVLGVPDWLKEAARAEYYIKTGLVILGAGILFLEILQAGAFGILQAVLVVVAVWYACFYLARKLRVDDDFAAMLSTAVSICGVSAAIAACGAIKGDRKKLSYVISLVLIVAVPMMILEPWIARVFGIPDVVAGAWLGGTLDTTGSVVAAGALISEPAMKTGVIVKFSQNVLIGVAAFILSLWWTFKKGAENRERPSARIIWERFPKFVLGFLIASFVFSFLLDPKLIADTKGILGGLRTVWFALAFTSIGLETRFTELVGLEGGRPAIAFLGAQVFNVVLTLILAYLLFGGILFQVPVIR